MVSKKKSNEWYKNGVIYGLDIETFFDANADGIGDFKGATSKLPYLEDLGVTCIWLLPFYPTANRDNGYDVTEYKNIDSRLGTLEDFRTFIQEAKKRKIRLILDLVVHHTSDKHPWFVAATTNAKSTYRNYYIWSKQIPPKPHDKSIFPGEESGVWHYDEHALSYYHHKFYHFEPDLHIANPDVQEEIKNIVDFWLSFDIDGFRIDAATHLFDDKGIPGTGIKNKEKFISDLRRFVEVRRSDAVILGEADVERKKIEMYLGDDDRFQLLFNFLLTNNLFYSLATKDASAVRECIEDLKKISSMKHFVNFLRNLDELDLEQLSLENRETVFKKFAPSSHMRIYDRGIRRRLAPMLEGNSAHLKMAWSLLFSLPGVPLFVYGDEIGMGEDLSQKARVSVRTPMQWTDGENAGFSTAKKKNLVRNIISKGPFSYKKVNVGDQKNSKDSLYRFIKSLIQIRRKYPIFTSSECTFLDMNDPSILGIQYIHSDLSLVVFHNLSDKEKVLGEDYLKEDSKEILSDSSYKKTDVKLHAFGYRWFVKQKKQ